MKRWRKKLHCDFFTGLGCILHLLCHKYFVTLFVPSSWLHTFSYSHFCFSSFSSSPPLPYSCLLEQFFLFAFALSTCLTRHCLRLSLFLFNRLSLFLAVLTVSFILVAVNFFYSRQNTLHTRKNRHLSVNSTDACIGGRARCKATHHNSLASLFSLSRCSSNYLNQCAFHIDSSMCAFVSCRRERKHHNWEWEGRRQRRWPDCLSCRRPQINGTICLTTIFTVASVVAVYAGASGAWSTPLFAPL